METSPHQHTPHHQLRLRTPVDRCPWCNSEISHEEFLRIKREIRAEEEATLDEQRRELELAFRENTEALQREAGERVARAREAHEKELARRLDESHARETALREQLRRASDEENKKALEAQREELERRFTTDSAERQLAAERALQERAEEIARLQSEAATRAEASQKATEALEETVSTLLAKNEDSKAQLAAMKEHEATIREEAKAEEREALQERLKTKDDELQKARAAQAAAQEALRESQDAKEAAIEEAKKSVLKQVEVAHRVELLEQRKVLEEDTDRKLLDQRAEHNRKNERLEKKVKELQRQVEEKTASELGEGPEIDLFLALRDEYPEDKITRIDRGAPGADIRFEILDQGNVVGKILIESKNRQQWRNSYVDKLRTDQREEKAEHAILSSNVFPSEAEHQRLCVVNGTIVTDPRHAIFLVGILRESIVHMHRLRLSTEERDAKVDALYEFIISTRYRQLFDRAEEVTKQLDELDAKEKTTHANVWNKRGLLVQSLRRNLQTVDRDVRTIIEGTP